MRLVVLSDTHGQHDKITDVPEGDILIHAGDFMNSGTDLLEIISFNRWLGEHRTPLAFHWNLLTDLKAEDLQGFF